MLSGRQVGQGIHTVSGMVARRAASVGRVHGVARRVRSRFIAGTGRGRPLIHAGGNDLLGERRRSRGIFGRAGAGSTDIAMGRGGWG